MLANFLTKLSWSFARQYRITIMLWLILLVFGFLSYTISLGKEGFPPVELPIAVVRGTYFVNNPTQVDQEVLQPLISSLEEIDLINSFTTTAGTNFYSVFIEFDESVSPEEGAKEIQVEIDKLTNLPESTNPEVSAINATAFDNKYNLLLAVYDQKNSAYEDLFPRAEKVAVELNENADIKSAEAISVIETVTDVNINQEVTRQTNINKVGIRENGAFNFYPAITVGVTKKSGVNDIELSEAVKNTINDLKNNDDFADVNMTITADFATTINEQISSLETSLLGSLLAVLTIALLLISWRAAIVIALFIPTVMAASFIGLELFGYTLNTITLFALILTLGLLVDDATIIVEAIDANGRNKSSHKDIIKTAIKRVGVASLAGTLTTLLVFTPMLAVSGILGSFIRLLPITVILTLSLSLIISLILVPFLTRPFVISAKRKTWLDKLSILVKVEDYLSTKLSALPLYNKTRPSLGYLMTTVMVSISISAVIAAFFFSSLLPLDIFPKAKDSNILQANINFEPNTSIDDAEEITNSIDEKIVNTINDDLSYITYISGNERQATLEIGLIPFKERDLTSHNILANLADEAGQVNGTDISYYQLDAGPPAQDFPFQMRIYSSDDTVLEAAAEDVKEFLLNRELKIGQETTAITEVEIDGTDFINRTREGRFVSVAAKYDNTKIISGAVMETEKLIQEEYNTEKLTDLGLNERAFDFNVGQESENAESFSSIGTGLIVALALMYLLLIVLFNSFSQPLLIFMAIPFSLFGVFFGLWATDNALSFFVMLGLLGLIGIVVNNTILLVEYANQERAKGLDRHKAISNAMKDRFRPIVTTTLTTVFALLPLALTDPFWQPLAFTLIFGLLSSTILIILSFPYYYLFFERIRDWKNMKMPYLE